MSELANVRRPIQIGPVQIRNRIVDPARTLFYSTDYALSDRHIAFYRERALGGAGLLITEQQAAHPTGKGSFFRSCTAYESRSVPRFAEMANVVHEHGARVFVQLYTPGVHDTGTMVMDDWRPVWGASTTISAIHRATPMVMRPEHIRSLAEGYARSAGNVLAAGVDGIEIQAAHGYGLAQFLSPWYNRRDDAYGGSPEKRCRLVIDVARAIREVVGDRMAVGIRLSYDEYRGSDGVTAEESDAQVGRMVDTGLFNFFNISGGGYGTFHLSSGSMRTEQGHMAPFGKRAKAIVGDAAAVMIVGRIKRIEMADELIGDGFADMVCMGRAQLADAFVVAKALSGRSDEIRRCIGVNRCIARLAEQREVICAVNPIAGREARWGQGRLRKHAAADSRRIAVIGGGPAGLRAAATLAARGHQVELFDDGHELGGHLRLLARLPTRGEWLEAVEDLVSEAVRSGVRMVTDTRATAATLAEINADVTVLATGSHWDATGFSAFRPSRGVPAGLADRRTLALDRAVQAELDVPGRLGHHVVIVDESGSYMPYGLAELLALRGARVQVVSPHLVGPDELVRTQEINYIMPILRRAGSAVRTQLALSRAEGARVIFRDVWSGVEEEVDGVDTLVLAMLRRPNDNLLREARSRPIVAVGDAVAPRDVSEVIYEAERFARDFEPTVSRLV